MLCINLNKNVIKNGNKNKDLVCVIPHLNVRGVPAVRVLQESRFLLLLRGNQFLRRVCRSLAVYFEWWIRGLPYDRNVLERNGWRERRKENKIRWTFFN